VGGGVGGLAAALAFGRAGHPVTLVERDPLPATPDVEAAFVADRRGAPQVHQTHGFLARMVVELRQRFPDVLDDLLAAGCTTMPAAANLGEPRPGDEDLALLIVRRTTFEWVLRRAVLAEPGVEVRTGVGATGLVVAGAGAGTGTTGAGAAGTQERPGPRVPVVTGVRLDAGTTLDADIVVASTGRRSSVPGWLGAHGVPVPETVHESGLVYLSRWYRLPPALDVAIDPKLGADLRYLKYLAVPGDARTLSVTLAVRAGDGELRAALGDANRFDRACAALPGPDRFFAGGPVEPLGPVLPMGGLLNRLRRFVDAAGQPAVLGFHAVGDAHTCTNPLYGRGCSLALVQAGLLADAAAAHPGDPAGRARRYEAACEREVEPWFHVSVQMDAAGSDPSGAGALASGDDGQARGLAALFVAAATDPIIGRGIARFMNLLQTPAQLMADGELMTRMAEVMADPDAYPPPPVAGPGRRELLAQLGATAA
jgi:2-polyprenyl-6-methoxyphenol hydroxylase-like FAD-dependent oxidoreductase